MKRLHTSTKLLYVAKIEYHTRIESLSMSIVTFIQSLFVQVCNQYIIRPGVLLGLAAVSGVVGLLKPDDMDYEIPTAMVDISLVGMYVIFFKMHSLDTTANAVVLATFFIDPYILVPLLAIVYWKNTLQTCGSLRNKFFTTISNQRKYERLPTRSYSYTYGFRAESYPRVTERFNIACKEYCFYTKTVLTGIRSIFVLIVLRTWLSFVFQESFHRFVITVFIDLVIGFEYFMIQCNRHRLNHIL